MSGAKQLQSAIQDGDVAEMETLCRSIEWTQSEGKELEVAVRRAAERVVAHRPQYRTVVQLASECGIHVDLWTASRAGLVEIVKQHLAASRNQIDKLDSQGRSPLQRAALVYGVCNECEEVVDCLLEMGATVDLFTAATFCDRNAVDELLASNRDLVTSRCEGSTALNWAVRPRRNLDDAPHICRALIEAGADISDKDEYESDMTPLHHAAEWGPRICIQLVDILLSSGADINAVDGQGWTPLDYAQDRRRSDMTEHLITLGAKNRE